MDSTRSGAPVYAGFWLRVAASLIDSMVLCAAFLVAMLLFGLGALGTSLAAPDRPQLTATFVLAIFGFLLLMFFVPWLYHAGLESSARQATLGKMACGIKVTDLQGQRISFARATGRHFAEIITGMTWFVGYLMVAFTKKRQTLHDMIAETLVVDAGVAPEGVVNSPPAKPVSGWGIAGIVAAVLAIPALLFALFGALAFREFSLRTRIDQGLALAADYQAVVEAHVDATGRWPADIADLHPDAARRIPAEGGDPVASVEIWDGTVVLSFGGDAPESIRDQLLSVRPYRLADGRIVWQCGNAAMADGVAVTALDLDPEMPESSVGVTSIADLRLPVHCRMNSGP